LRASIPTPAQSVLELGPLTIHYYALCIITGIALAIWLGHTRFKIKTAQGQSVVSEVAIVAVPSGIIGGRIYHVISSPNAYFGSGGAPLDALAPGILLAQAIGRFGNWFNGELFGKPLDTWWALEIPVRYRPSGYSQFETFHPTFLYEAIWCTAIAVLILKFGKRLKAGQSFALYVASYCLGRFFIELIRIDSANTIAGLRVNVWVSVAVGAGAALYFARASKRIE
jgi:prolipoprotein diacylglyceryltransferase